MISIYMIGFNFVMLIMCLQFEKGLKENDPETVAMCRGEDLWATFPAAITLALLWPILIGAFIALKICRWVNVAGKKGE